jgi:uncharacterized membrane protein
MKAFLKQSLNNNFKLEKWQIFGITCLVIALTGFFGWIYEFFLYYLNSGMKEFYWRGSNFLPWINIYAIGALLIILTTYKFRKKPLYVALIAALVTGILEYISGFIIYHLFDGLRLWDYNTEILNFGNIDGFICFRSIAFFALSSLILMYLIVPFCIYLSQKMSKKAFLTISITLFSIIMIDEIYNLLIARFFNLPRAYDIYYKMLGIKYN